MITREWTIRRPQGRQYRREIRGSFRCRNNVGGAQRPKISSQPALYGPSKQMYKGDVLPNLELLSRQFPHFGPAYEPLDPRKERASKS